MIKNKTDTSTMWADEIKFVYFSVYFGQPVFSYFPLQNTHIALTVTKKYPALSHIISR